MRQPQKGCATSPTATIAEARSAAARIRECPVAQGFSPAPQRTVEPAGFAGIHTALYHAENTLMVFGDAKAET
ncbi:MAG: hypothetical protein A3H96_19175 [Acidobacteria bacterium RIFCSPLOWO2_02_FULL_67_36]|nr:MAG: hypothetical protein A3H96_19175 [Acidobacteria bacterium RIFCSPLOWO2_02_FULL_67_36]OFW25245.1 MAG: hypothetical protein A3G21_19700 [Acidobacteria bacterium RIFCSPLOWO2_12_FULL_66_21]